MYELRNVMVHMEKLRFQNVFMCSQTNSLRSWSQRLFNVTLKIQTHDKQIFKQSYQ